MHLVHCLISHSAFSFTIPPDFNVIISFALCLFTKEFLTHKKVHLPVDVLAGAGKLRDSPATHAPTLLLSVPHLIQRAQAHNPADAALSLKSRAAHGSGNTQSNNQQLGLHEQLIFFEASRGLPYDNIYQFRISYNKRTCPPTLRLLKSRATHRGFKPTPTINNLGYIRN